MQIKLAEMMDRLRRYEDELEAAFEEKQRAFKYRVAENRVRFDREIAALHLRFRKSIPASVRDMPWPTILTMPLIYSLVVPLAVLDLWVTVYQAVCFPIYGIEKVRRSDYLIIDHQFLTYLNPLEKLGCIYCSYANGLVAWIREIAARTEKHFCPIKHARRVPAPHSKYQEFFEYGDAQGFRQESKKPSEHC